jgi:hypothetical protein
MFKIKYSKEKVIMGIYAILFHFGMSAYFTHRIYQFYLTLEGKEIKMKKGGIEDKTLKANESIFNYNQSCKKFEDYVK